MSGTSSQDRPDEVQSSEPSNHQVEVVDWCAKAASALIGIAMGLSALGQELESAMTDVVDSPSELP